MTKMITINLPNKGGNIYLNSAQRDALLAMGMAQLRATKDKVLVGTWVGYNSDSEDGWKAPLFLTLRTGRELEIPYKIVKILGTKGLAELEAEKNKSPNMYGSYNTTAMWASLSYKGWQGFGQLLAESMTADMPVAMKGRAMVTKDTKGKDVATVDLQRFALLWDETHFE